VNSTLHLKPRKILFRANVLYLTTVEHIQSTVQQFKPLENTV